VLTLRRSQVFRSTNGPSVTAPLAPPLVTDVWTCDGGTGWGNRNSGGPFPVADPTARPPSARLARLAQENGRLCSCQSAASGLTPAALCAAGIALRATVAVERQGKRGVSDPRLAAPFFARRPARRGSLTPHMHVTIIRRDSATPVTLSTALPFPGPLRARFISAVEVSDRFRRELAFI
jgi:hypothetical protein